MFVSHLQHEKQGLDYRLVYIYIKYIYIYIYFIYIYIYIKQAFLYIGGNETTLRQCVIKGNSLLA
jgi:hypothetical protein